MRIVVPVKQVRELHEGFTIRDGVRVDPDFVDLVINEWDTYALAAAVEISQAAGDIDVVAVCVDAEDPAAVLRGAVAQGASRAVHIALPDGQEADTILVARLVAAFVADQDVDLVLCGVQSADGGSGATASAVAGVLQWPRVSSVVGIEARKASASVRRELDGGAVEHLEVPLPAVLALQSGSYAVPYPTMKAKMAAKKAVIELVDPEVLVKGSTQSAGVRGAASLGMAARVASSAAQGLGDAPNDVARAIRTIIEEQLS